MTGMLELPRPVALVLSGGSSLGSIQAGMLLALVEAGIVPDFIVGTSVGALNGAYMAADWSRDRVDALGDIWLGIRAGDVFPRLGLVRALRMLGAGNALVSPSALQALIDRCLPAAHAALTIPTSVVATALDSGHSVVLDKGDLRRNVLASAAIPGVFPAVEVDGTFRVDGGVSAQVPLLPARALGARTVVVLDVGVPCALKVTPTGVVAPILRVLQVALHHQTTAALDLLAAECVVLYLPSPCPLSVAPYDFSQTAALMHVGHTGAAHFLAGVQVDGSGIYGHPHRHD